VRVKSIFRGLFAPRGCQKCALVFGGEGELFMCEWIDLRWRLNSSSEFIHSPFANWHRIVDGVEKSQYLTRSWRNRFKCFQCGCRLASFVSICICTTSLALALPKKVFNTDLRLPKKSKFETTKKIELSGFSRKKIKWISTYIANLPRVQIVAWFPYKVFC